MKVILNAYNLKVAGGLNVAFNFINQLKNYPNDTFFVFAPQNCDYEKLQSDSIKIILVPDIFQNYLLRFYLDYFWIPSKIRPIQPDVIFSMGNFPLPVSMKQALLFHYPYLIYMREGKKIMSFSEKILLQFQYWVFKSRLKYVDRIFPQTKIAGVRLQQFYGKDLRVVPIPNAYTKLEAEKDRADEPMLNLPAGFNYLICLTKYYPHKNIEILLEVAKLIRARGSTIRFITTIAADQHKRAALFLDAIKQQHLEAYIYNIGPVNMYDVPRLYEETQGLILPTLLESFTATYVDAMHFGKPIYTSNRDFALEICGDAAYYFDPGDPVDIFNKLTESFTDREEMDKKLVIAQQRIKAFPDWKMVTEMYMNQLRAMV